MNRGFYLWGFMFGLGLCLVSHVSAQPGALQERLESLKIAHITEELSLTSREAQQFWPVYNEYAEELEELRQGNERRKNTLRQKMLASDEAELEKLADEYLESQGGKWEIQKRYHSRFKEVLPIRKVILLYKAEEEFNQKIFTELARRRIQNRLQQRNGFRKNE